MAQNQNPNQNQNLNQNQNQAQNPKDQKSCEVCSQTFNSDRELQEHLKTAHQNRPAEKQPTSERNQPGRTQGEDSREQGDREKIA